MVEYFEGDGESRKGTFRTLSVVTGADSTTRMYVGQLTEDKKTMPATVTFVDEDSFYVTL